MSGTTSSTTGIVSCHEYNSISASAPKICAIATIHAMPPHSVNLESVSMSAVTLATKTPRRSRVCAASESRWMCAKVRTRRFVRARSDVRASRRPATRPAR
jgi:hypothetical protein